MIQGCIIVVSMPKISRNLLLNLNHKICGKSNKTDYEFVRFGPTSSCEIRTSTASPDPVTEAFIRTRDRVQ